MARLPAAAASTGPSTSSTSTCPTPRRWAGWWWPPSPAARRPVTMYTEHSLWNKVAVLVKALNRATVRLRPGPGRRVPGRLRRPSPAAAAPGPGGGPRRGPRHGPRPWSARRDEVRRPGAGRARCPAGRGAGGDRGQPPIGEGIRRAAGRGRPRRSSGACPVRFAAAGQGAQEAELVARHHAAGAGRAVPLPRPPRRCPRAAGGRRHLRARLPPGGPARRPDGGGERGRGHRGHRGRGRAPGGRSTASTGWWCPRATRSCWPTPSSGWSPIPSSGDRLGRQAMADSTRYDIARASAEIEDIYRRLLAAHDSGDSPDPAHDGAVARAARASSARRASSRPSPNSVSGSR